MDDDPAGWRRGAAAARGRMHKFRVEEVIGEGAYGVVLRCRERATGLTVAVKKFKASDADDAKVRKTTLREVRLLKLLRDGPNVVTLLEAFHRAGKLYLVFEHMDRSLLQLLRDMPDGVPVWQTRLYTYQLLKAIGWCHAHDVYHRDIKPENLLVNDDHALRLCDFGLATSAPRDSKSAPLTDYVATRWYRAPELLLGSTSYAPSVDEWAVGCILGELAQGSPAFAGDSDIDQLHLIQSALGPLTASQHELFMANPKYAGLKFADMSRPAGLHVMFGGHLPLVAVSCLSRLLTLEPADRSAAADLTSHRWFDGVIDPSEPSERAEAEMAPPVARGAAAAMTDGAVPQVESAPDARGAAAATATGSPVPTGGAAAVDEESVGPSNGGSAPPESHAAAPALEPARHTGDEPSREEPPAASGHVAFASRAQAVAALRGASVDLDRRLRRAGIGRGGADGPNAAPSMTQGATPSAAPGDPAADAPAAPSGPARRAGQWHGAKRSVSAAPRRNMPPPASWYRPPPPGHHYYTAAHLAPPHPRHARRLNCGAPSGGTPGRATPRAGVRSAMRREPRDAPNDRADARPVDGARRRRHGPNGHAVDGANMAPRVGRTGGAKAGGTKVAGVAVVGAALAAATGRPSRRPLV